MNSKYQFVKIASHKGEIIMQKLFGIFIIILLFSVLYVYGESNEDIMLPAEGLEIYCIDQESETQNSVTFCMNLSLLYMDEFQGYGTNYIWMTENYTYFDLRFSIFTEEHSDYYSELLQLNMSIGKYIYYSDIVKLSIAHNFNYVEYYQEDEYESVWCHELDTAFSSIFSPSINLNLELGYNFTDNMAVNYKLTKYLWYTAPEFEFDNNNYRNKEVSDIIDIENSINLIIKF